MKKNNFVDYSVSDAIKKYPSLKYRLPMIMLEDDKYLVRVRTNADGSLDIEVGYPEDDFIIAV